MKRRKTITAGRLVYAVCYTVPNPRATKRERKKIREVTQAQVERTRCNTAQRKLELLLAANFSERDPVLTLTFDDAHLPRTAQDGAKCIRKLFAGIREYRRARGQPELKYVYIAEGRHGDHRLHYHLIINGTGNDLELVRSLWVWGEQIDISYLGDHGYDGWAGYLSKERREAALNGKRQWVPSRNLEKPQTRTEWVDDETTVDAPPGAVILDEGGGRNELASCKFIKYLLPMTAPRARVISGSKLSTTYGKREQKRRETLAKPPNCGYNYIQENRA